MSRSCSKVAGEYLRQVSFGLWNVFWQLIIFSTHTASIWDREYAFWDRKYEKNVFTNSVLFHPKWSKNDLDTTGIGLGSDFYYLFHFLVAKITSLGSEKSRFGANPCKPRRPSKSRCPAICLRIRSLRSRASGMINPPPLKSLPRIRGAENPRA